MNKLIVPIALAGAALVAVTATTAAISPACVCASVAKVTNVRFGSHLGFDRVTIQFANSRLPSHISVTKPFSLHFDPSGHGVPLNGKANVLVVLSDTDAHTNYEGPRFIKDLDMKFLHGFVKLGDFENVVSFGITTNVADPHVQFFTLENPTRLVIDIWK